MRIQKVAVLGMGAMGNGIIQVVATAGYEVCGMDIQDALIEKGMATIKKSLERQVKAGKVSAEVLEEILSRITTTKEIKEAVAEADMVIEAIPEIMELKQRIFREVDTYAPDDAILASNTSELSITSMAAVTKKPGQFIGMHWFNPPPVMKLIEIVKGLETTEETVKIMEEFSHSLGKTTVVCKDAQGFITTRALTAHMLECMRILEEGVATPEDIDTAIKLGLNYPMGPFELGDYVGLDVMYHVCEGMVEAFGDRFRPPQILRNLVNAGHIGVKSGKGFYDWSQRKSRG